VDYSSNGFTISQLLKAGTHLGHTYKRAAMAPFIQGRRNNIFLLDISRTAYRLKQALDVTREIARRGGVILFFNPRESFRELTIQAALRCRQYYAVNPWTEGRLSNRAVLLRSQKYVPDLIILTTLIDATPLVNETRSLNIPTIGICDSNTDPSTVTYPIPGNDDSYPSMELFTSLFSNAAREGLLLGRAQKSLNEDWAKRAMADYQKEERSEMRRPGPRP
jgi:small subunit ribosomal protein S2